MTFDREKQKFTVLIMSAAFKRTLSELIGPAGGKAPIELVAWSLAFGELEQEFSQALLKDDVLN